MENIYLDNAATCLVPPRVLDKAAEFTDMLRDPRLSTGDVTRKQRASLSQARTSVARFLGNDLSPGPAVPHRKTR